MNAAPLKHPETVTITLTLPEIDLVLACMGQRPFDQVAPLIGNIRTQVVEQIAAFNAAPPDDKNKGQLQ